MIDSFYKKLIFDIDGFHENESKLLSNVQCEISLFSLDVPVVIITYEYNRILFTKDDGYEMVVEVDPGIYDIPTLLYILQEKCPNLFIDDTTPHILQSSGYCMIYEDRSLWSILGFNGTERFNNGKCVPSSNIINKVSGINFQLTSNDDSNVDILPLKVSGNELVVDNLNNKISLSHLKDNIQIVFFNERSNDRYYLPIVGNPIKPFHINITLDVIPESNMTLSSDLIFNINDTVKELSHDIRIPHKYTKVRLTRVIFSSNTVFVTGKCNVIRWVGLDNKTRIKIISNFGIYSLSSLLEELNRITKLSGINFTINERGIITIEGAKKIIHGKHSLWSSMGFDKSSDSIISHNAERKEENQIKLGINVFSQKNREESLWSNDNSESSFEINLGTSTGKTIIYPEASIPKIRNGKKGMISFVRGDYILQLRGSSMDPLSVTLSFEFYGVSQQYQEDNNYDRALSFVGSLSNSFDRLERELIDCESFHNNDIESLRGTYKIFIDKCGKYISYLK